MRARRRAPPPRLRALALALASSLALALAMPGDVTWLAPSAADPHFHTDGMPSGNGRTVATAWGDQARGALRFFVRSPLALATDGQFYTIALVTVALSPNPFAAGAFWNQTHALADGSVTLLGGGASLADHAAALSLYVDANSDSVVVSAASAAPLSLNVTVESVRPAQRFSYAAPNGSMKCNGTSSGPDVFAADGALPAPAPSGSLAMWHANDLAAGDSRFFEEAMALQGLSALLANFSDPLDGRIFGVGVTGGAGADGAGAPLLRASPATLLSGAPATAFSVRVVMRADPAARGDVAGWLQAVADELAAGPPPAQRKALSDAFWAQFWQRSYIALPAVAPQLAPVGVLPCDGRAEQVVRVDSASGLVTLAGGRCLAQADGRVFAGPCNSGTAWRLAACTAKGCAAGDSWMLLNVSTCVQSQLAAGCPRVIQAQCPYETPVSFGAPSDPTDAGRAQLWALNATDSTLRSLSAGCGAGAGAGTGAAAPSQCLTAAVALPDAPSDVAAMYARVRYMFAAQSRGVAVPIKFNGQLFMTQAVTNDTSTFNDPSNAFVDYRYWGQDFWWQNVREPYQSMLAQGDIEEMRVVLEYAAAMLPLNRARSQLLNGFDSASWVEISDVFGLFQGEEYGCSGGRPPGMPALFENGDAGWTRYDFGGNGLGLEAGLMAVGFCWATALGDAECPRYLQVATLALDFFDRFYNRTASGALLLFPTQVLETWWCGPWPDYSQCARNDLPQLAGLAALTRAVLQLPDPLLSPAQRARYAALQASLPALPRTPDGLRYAPAYEFSWGPANSEMPELFGPHPFRLETVGRSVAAGGGGGGGGGGGAVDLGVATATWFGVPLNQENSGWGYGAISAANLGLAEQAYSMVANRIQAPAAGYRWPAFATGGVDWAPQADHYAVLEAALQAMLLQGGEDGAAATIVLLPAWPCVLDVSFKLWGALNTSVEVVYSGGKLLSLSVEPPSRAGAVKFAGCVSAADAAAAMTAVAANARRPQ